MCVRVRGVGKIFLRAKLPLRGACASKIFLRFRVKGFVALQWEEFLAPRAEMRVALRWEVAPCGEVCCIARRVFALFARLCVCLR